MCCCLPLPVRREPRRLRPPHTRRRGCSRRPAPGALRPRVEAQFMDPLLCTGAVQRDTQSQPRPASPKQTVRRGACVLLEPTAGERVLSLGGCWHQKSPLGPRDKHGRLLQLRRRFPSKADHAFLPKSPFRTLPELWKADAELPPPRGSPPPGPSLGAAPSGQAAIHAPEPRRSSPRAAACYYLLFIIYPLPAQSSASPREIAYLRSPAAPEISERAGKGRGGGEGKGSKRLSIPVLHFQVFQRPLQCQR